MASKSLKLLLWCLAAAFVSCGGVYDDAPYASHSYFVIVNNSSHEIEIDWDVLKTRSSISAEDLFVKVPDRTYLPSGESVTYSYGYLYESSKDERIAPPSWKWKSAVISYDKTVVYRLSYDDCEHSLFDSASYDFEKIEKRVGRYTYTFTDADYEYAKTNRE